MNRIKELYTHFLSHPFVCTDTRKIVPGSIFFALKGGNFNGNHFAKQALEAGSYMCVVDEKEAVISEACFLVDDVLTALQELASYHRDQLAIPIIAITGSNGKTTTKELVKAVLSKKHKIFATSGNLNNHIGVPLSLLSIDSSHELAIIEMGANHQGEIAFLCKLAKPNFGLITNVGKAHLEGFGGVEGVIKGKTEMYRFLETNGGKVFVNYHSPALLSAAAKLSVFRYGTEESLDLTGKILRENPSVEFSYHTKNNATESDVIHSHLMGYYNFENLLSAAAIGEYFKVPQKDICAALENYIPDNSRSQIIKKEKNTILLDAYNANPSSMEVAIRNFAESKPVAPLLIIGDMFELGAESATEHEKVVELIQSLGFKDVVLVGKNFKESEGGNQFKRFENTQIAFKYLSEHIPLERVIFIKGSRGMALEKLLEIIP